MKSVVSYVKQKCQLIHITAFRVTPLRPESGGIKLYTITHHAETDVAANFLNSDFNVGVQLCCCYCFASVETDANSESGDTCDGNNTEPRNVLFTDAWKSNSDIESSLVSRHSLSFILSFAMFLTIIVQFKDRVRLRIRDQVSY